MAGNNRKSLAIERKILSIRALMLAMVDAILSVVMLAMVDAILSVVQVDVVDAMPKYDGSPGSGCQGCSEVD